MQFRLLSVYDTTSAVVSAVVTLFLAWWGVGYWALAHLLFRFGEQLFDREAGILSVAVMVSLQEMFKTAANARPYAIGLLLIIGSTLQLRWIRSGHARNLAAYIVLAALAVICSLPVCDCLFGARRLCGGIGQVGQDCLAEGHLCGRDRSDPDQPNYLGCYSPKTSLS
jgi:hypothetical protein